MKNQLSIVQVDNEQMTIHSLQQTQLETPFHPPARRKRKPLHLMMHLNLIGCMEILLLKLVAIVFGLD